MTIRNFEEHLQALKEHYADFGSNLRRRFIARARGWNFKSVIGLKRNALPNTLEGPIAAQQPDLEFAEAS